MSSGPPLTYSSSSRVASAPTAGGFPPADQGLWTSRIIDRRDHRCAVTMQRGTDRDRSSWQRSAKNGPPIIEHPGIRPSCAHDASSSTPAAANTTRRNPTRFENSASPDFATTHRGLLRKTGKQKRRFCNSDASAPYRGASTTARLFARKLPKTSSRLLASAGLHTREPSAVNNCADPLSTSNTVIPLRREPMSVRSPRYRPPA